jgi:hypothetical protein
VPVTEKLPDRGPKLASGVTGMESEMVKVELPFITTLKV